MIETAYKFRIYPNSNQKEYFAKCFGCVRFFYNKSLEDTINEYKQNNKRVNITPAQYKNEFPFLKEYRKNQRLQNNPLESPHDG